MNEKLEICKGQIYDEEKDDEILKNGTKIKELNKNKNKGNKK